MKWIPHPYQRRALIHTLNNPYSAIFLDPGLGKTSIALAAIKLLILKGELEKCALVVAPLRVMQNVWPSERDKWDNFQDIDIVAIHGSRKYENLYAESDIKVTTPDMIKWIVKTIQNHGGVCPFDGLWIDESTKFKNRTTARFAQLKKILPDFKHRHIMSGTPTPNDVRDIWAQMQIVDRGERLGNDFERFQKQTMDRGWGQFSYEERPEARRMVARAIKDVTIRMRAKDWLKLPELIEEDVEITLPPKAMKQYKIMENEMYLQLEESDDPVTAINAAAKTLKCWQISNGFVYNEDGEAADIHDAKVEALKELVEESANRQIMISYYFKHDKALLQDAFPGARVLTDNVNAVSEDWNSGKARLMLVHQRSAAHGLNLQGAGGPIHIIWFGLTWSLESYLQVNARAHRQGVKSNVVVHRVIAKGTIDMLMRERLSKRQVADMKLTDALLAWRDGNLPV